MADGCVECQAAEPTTWRGDCWPKKKAKGSELNTKQAASILHSAHSCSLSLLHKPRCGMMSQAQAFRICMRLDSEHEESIFLLRAMLATLTSHSGTARPECLRTIRGKDEEEHGVFPLLSAGLMTKAGHVASLNCRFFLCKMPCRSVVK